MLKYMLRYIIFALVMSIVMISISTLVFGGTIFDTPDKLIGLTIFSDYLDDEKGLQLYEYEEETNANIKKSKKLNLGKFMRDLLKVNANKDIIENCQNNIQDQTFSTCIDQTLSDDQILQIKYDKQMNDIRTMLEFGKEHGIMMIDIPFVKDFLDE